MNTTEHYQLNQWEGSDRIMREDFNADNRKTEEALTENIRTEAVEALTALGYSGAEALRAVKQVELTEDMTVEELLKASLKKIQ